MHRANAYAVAVLAIGASFALRLTLDPWLGANVPYLHFFPAITLASWFGGFGPGAVATATSTLMAMYYFLPPAGFAVTGTADLVSLPLFIATGLGIAWLSHLYRAAEAAHSTSADLAKARAERLDAVLRTAVDGIIVINAKGKIEVFNGGAARLFGYPEEEVLGRNVSMLMPSPHHESHDQYLARYLTTGDAKIIGTGREVMGRRRDGTTFPLHLSVGEMWIDGERKYTGMLHDLSARVQLEERLRNSEERWRSIVDSAVDAIVVIDAYGRIEAFNPAAERLFGYDEAGIKGQNIKLLMPSPYHEQHDGYLARYHATREPRIIGSGREVTGRRRDGATFPLHLSVGELTVQGEHKFTGILHDLSGRVRMEAQLREQATLVRLGEMAAVVAHEVKNPLAGIRGAIQVLGGRFPAGAKEGMVVNEIIGRIDTLTGLMGDLLLFARPPQPRVTSVEVAALVTTTIGLLAEDPALREVEIQVEGTAPPVSADPELLKIVFQNLLVNGAHAMQGRGRITVGVRAIDSQCEVTFKDSGPGIPPDIREKIFTPFFTTKSRGSGLGLPTSKSLIEAHHGRISIQCPPEGGTAVTIQLPVS